MLQPEQIHVYHSDQNGEEEWQAGGPMTTDIIAQMHRKEIQEALRVLQHVRSMQKATAASLALIQSGADAGTAGGGASALLAVQYVLEALLGHPVAEVGDEG